LGAIWKPLGTIWTPLEMIWEHCQKFETMLGDTRFFIEFGIIWGSIWAPFLETILHIGDHLWWLGGSKWHRFSSDAFYMATRTWSG